MSAHRWLHGFLAVTLGSAGLSYVSDLRAEWTEVATLARPTDLGGDGASFGERAVACGGGTVLVGAPTEDNYSGAVYAFSGPGFSDVQRFTVPDTDSFGGSLAISGDTAIVSDTQIDDGSAWIFVRQGGVWTHQQTLVGSGDARFGAFGNKVALRGDIAVVSAPKEAGDLGRIHVFRREASVWTEEAVLTAGDGMMNDFFGLGVGFDEDALVAGAPTNPIDDSPRGAAYIFTRAAGAWSQQARFDLSGQNPTSPAIYFGGSVAIDGDWAVVSGSAGTDAPVEPRAYVYQQSGDLWRQVQAIMLSGSENRGAPAVVQGDRIFIQSASGDTRSLHEYRLDGGQWSEQQSLPAFASSSVFAVCGGTLVRTNAPSIVLYQDPTVVAMDPTTPTGGGGGGPSQPIGGAAGDATQPNTESAQADDEGGGCSYRTAPPGGPGAGVLGMALLALLGAPRLRRRRPGAR